MDDVDFTVLAATSILSDLMEVCPPAETCRDAFERMSRATVRMGSKGFASQAVGGVSLTAPTRSLSSTTNNTNRPGAQNAQLASAQRAQQAQRPTRRAPTFDMDLSDLYQSPPNQQSHLLPRQRSYQSTQAVAAQPEQYQSNTGYPQAYTGYEQTAQQQQQQYYMAQSPQSAGSAPPNFASPTHSEQHGLTDLSLDFLDFANSNNINQDTDMNNPDGSATLNNHPGLGSGLFNPNDMQGTGINLAGFGLEADYLRDLTTDGSGYDLMDGYWFGMSGGGNSGI